MKSNISLLWVLAFGTLLACKQDDGFEKIFNGKDLSGWVNVVNSPSTWSVDEQQIACTGAPTSFLRSAQQYENFILRFESSHPEETAISRLLLHSDALPAPGHPLPRGIALNLVPDSLSNFIAPVNGATINAVKRVTNKVDLGKYQKWNEYEIESQNGKIALKINGKVISEGTGVSPRKGYIALLSEGSEIIYKNIRIKALPTSNPAEDEVATLDEGFVPLYNRSDLMNWDHKPGHKNHWTAADWRINYDGKSEEKDRSLWSKKEYGDFILIADLKFTREPKMELMPVVLPNGNNALNEDGSNKEEEVMYAGDTGIYLRGDSKNQVNMGTRPIGSGEIYGYRVDKKLPPEVRAGAVPKLNADNPPGQWNRFVISMIDDRVTITLNDKLVIDNALLPGIAASGPIALQDDHADNNTFQFANLFIKELN